VENIETHFMFGNFFPENRAVYEKMWKKVLEPDRPKMTKCGACALRAG